MTDIRNAKNWVVTPPPENTLIYVLDIKSDQGWQVRFPEELSNRSHENLYWKTEPHDEPKISPEEFYWILGVLDYGKVVFFGTAGAAEELQELWGKREGRPVSLRKADRANAGDKKLVQDEISAVIADIRAGIKIFPLPSEGWV